MQKLNPQSKKQKAIKIPLGIVIAGLSLFAGAFGIIGVVIGLSIAGNAVFAKTRY